MVVQRVIVQLGLRKQPLKSTKIWKSVSPACRINGVRAYTTTTIQHHRFFIDKENTDKKKYFFSTSSSSTENNNHAKDEENAENLPVKVYEGPLADLTLRLKRISIGSCVIGLFGFPTLYLCKEGLGSASQFFVVGGTSLLATCGSTLALHYCFSPYVHSLELITSSSDEDENNKKSNSTTMLKATTRNMFAQREETHFDPKKDVIHQKSSSSAITRPFCNFYVGEKPFYVHKELIEDGELFRQLFGEEEVNLNKNSSNENADKDDGIF